MRERDATNAHVTFWIQNLRQQIHPQLERLTVVIKHKIFLPNKSQNNSILQLSWHDPSQIPSSSFAPSYLEFQFYCVDVR